MYINIISFFCIIFLDQLFSLVIGNQFSEVIEFTPVNPV